MSRQPGWYDDPKLTGFERWWDGNAWTNQARLIGSASKESTHGLEEEQPREQPAPGSKDTRPLDLDDGATEAINLLTDAGHLENRIAELRATLIRTSDEALLQEVGIYEFSHPLDDSVAYKEQLAELREQIRCSIRQGLALSATDRWSINGSEREGTRMLKDLGKLMLRAYNTETDNVVRTLRPHKKSAAISRLDKMRESIAKLGSAMHLAITDEYHQLRIREIELTADYQAMRADERERAKEERERLREENAAQRELQREHERLAKEQRHYQMAIESLRARGETSAADDAASKLTEIEKALAGVIDREANIRAGYVYVISNIGAFGEGVVKIGLTRRLAPMDRIRELGDASVPYRFDVHALIFSEDAVSLERALHERFADKRMNLVNQRREFFSVSPAEVRSAIQELGGDLLSFTESAEALEWRQSRSMRRSSGVPSD